MSRGVAAGKAGALKLQRPKPEEVTSKRLAEMAGTSDLIIRRGRQKQVIPARYRLFAGTSQGAWYFQPEVLGEPTVAEYIARAKSHAADRWGVKSTSGQGELSQEIAGLREDIAQLRGEFGSLLRIIEKLTG